ncbi:MAG: cell wall hydrolase [Clostridiales bacterium]|nr:cell wall hydrolase [Clostridiales bacterium]
MTKSLPNQRIRCIITVTSAEEASQTIMKRQILAAVLLLIVIMVPTLGIAEDSETVMLAKTLYTLGDDSYETMIAIGTVVMNRADSPFFPDSVEGVLNQPHQFPRGNRYDEKAMDAAREIMMGARVFPSYVLYFNEVDGNGDWSTRDLYAAIGEYGFYNAEN